MCKYVSIDMGHKNREVDDFWGGKGPVRMREEQGGLYIYIYIYGTILLDMHKTTIKRPIIL